MSKVLIVDSQKCTGCYSCVLGCSFAHTKEFSMLSKIQVKKNKYEGKCEIKVCRQCENAPCVNICPTGALVKDDTGEVKFFAEKCVGCKQCISVCPYDAITINNTTNVIEKCDLCGGDPICAKVCTTGAITLSDND